MFLDMGVDEIIHLVTFCRVYWRRQRLEVDTMDLSIPPAKEEGSCMVVRMSLQVK